LIRGQADAGARACSGAQLRTVLYDLSVVGVLARPSLLRKSEQGMDFSRSWFGSRGKGLSIDMDRGWTGNVVDGVEDALRRSSIIMTLPTSLLAGK
jgi:hypothetical protein